MLPLAITDGAPLSSLSPRYGFVDTKKVIEIFQESGYGIAQTSVVRSRNIARTLSAKHLIRFRHPETVALNGVIPEVVFLNSHDGTSRAKFISGLFRMICANGLMVMDKEFAPAISLVHTLSNVNEVILSATRSLQQSKDVADMIPRLQERTLSDNELAKFGDEAMTVLGRPVQMASLFRVRRDEDARNTIWNVMNRVQENVIRGGVVTMNRTPRGMFRTTRGIRSVSGTINANTALWQLAVRTMKGEL